MRKSIYGYKDTTLTINTTSTNTTTGVSTAELQLLENTLNNEITALTSVVN